MKKQNLILSAALAAVFSASTAFAEAEVTGKIVHESCKFTTSGQLLVQLQCTLVKMLFKTMKHLHVSYIDGEADELQMVQLTT